MFTSETLLYGDLPDARVGIGCSTKNGIVENSATAIDKQRVQIYEDPYNLIDDLVDGNIDAVVRGNMSSATLLPILRSKLGLNVLERVAFIETHDKKMVVLSPVGIDEGWTIEQKYSLATKSVKLARRFGMDEKIAIMSGGRYEDLGRCEAVDMSMRNADYITNMLICDGYNAYNQQILIEDAIRDADIIIAPNGIIGNIIFRTLHFIGGARAIGAPIVNSNKVFVDTSRAKTDYRDSIALAMMLTRE